MFVDWKATPPPWEPAPRKRSTRKKDEKILLWIAGINLLAIFLGPIAGGTFFHAIAAALGY